MVEPKTLDNKPSLVLTLLGGLTATLLAAALLGLAPAVGLPFLDVPRLLAGIFVSGPRAAFGLGYALFFLAGVLVLAPLLVLAWSALPGRGVGFAGAIVKGALWGGVFWIISGLLLPIAGALGQVPELENPGFFGFGLGVPLAIAFFAIWLIYGLALALIAAAGQGISPVGSMGWEGYEHAETDQMILAAFRDQGTSAGSPPCPH